METAMADGSRGQTGFMNPRSADPLRFMNIIEDKDPLQ